MAKKKSAIKRKDAEAVLFDRDRGRAEVIALHAEIVEALRTSIEKAIRIGELLEQTKASLPHGEFGNWCESLPFTSRTARNYMRLWRERDRLKTENVSDLATAYKLLAAPEIETPEPASVNQGGAHPEPPEPDSPKAFNRMVEISRLALRLSRAKNESEALSIAMAYVGGEEATVTLTGIKFKEGHTKEDWEMFGHRLSVLLAVTGRPDPEKC